MRALRGLSAAAAGAMIFTASPALAAGIGSAIPLKAAAATTARFPLGLQPLNLRIAASAHLTGGQVSRGAHALPAGVDLTGDAVPVGNQGPVGSCVAWSEAYTIMGWYSKHQQHVGAPFAPMYMYSQINGGRDAGTTTTAGWKLAMNQGVAEWAAYPQGPYDWRDQPTTNERTNAALHKVGAATYLFSGSNQGGAAQTAISTALAGGNPVELAIPVYASFEALNSSNSYYPLSKTVGSQFLGYHAIAALGYDSTGVVVENSWGTGWGRSGYATIGWDFIDRYALEASVLSSGFATANSSAAPLVSKLSSAVASSTGGSTVRVTASRLASVDVTSQTAVTLVSLNNSAISVPAPATVVDASTLAVTIPAAPTDSNGTPVVGAYRVVLTGTGGTSSPNGTADVLNYIAPYAVSSTSTTPLPSTGGGVITLSGSGFGTTAALFSANHITATVNGAAVPVTWVSDTTLRVPGPVGVPGQQPTVVLSHQGVASAPVYGGTFAAVLNRTAGTLASTLGGTLLTVNGKGFNGSTDWGLVDGSGNLTDIPVVSPTAFATTSPAVVIDTDASARVKVPAVSAPGSYSFSFTPSSSLYAGAGTLIAPVAAVNFIVPLSGALSSSAVMNPLGGTNVTVTGSGFGMTATAFAALKATATLNGTNVPVQWRSDTQLTITAPVGKPGSSPVLVLYRQGIAGPASTNGSYAALISGATRASVPTAGGTITVVGKGFLGSGSWALLDSAGQSVADLPAAASLAALSAAGSGVYVSSDTSVVVKLPAQPNGVSMVSLSFTPDTNRYPGAAQALTSQAVITYSDLG